MSQVIPSLYPTNILYENKQFFMVLVIIIFRSLRFLLLFAFISVWKRCLVFWSGSSFAMGSGNLEVTSLGD